MAKTMSIDRFEGGYAICEPLTDGKPKKKKEQHYYGIDITELPQGAKEGDVLVIGDDGTLTLDEAATKSRREKLQKLQKSVWED
ncbi:MAG: DUF3006 domain-containing protein [Oscillospiraceae bacterium]|nr:DUF3006 domain-containing protein [Oscillospiraceae bacterium]